MQDFKVGFLQRLDQLQTLRGSLHSDFVSWFDGNARLPIQSEKNGFRVWRYIDFDRGRVTNDYGPIAEGVRADRSNDPRLYGRMYDRAAGG